MASYQPTILPAPQQYGFLPGLMQGLGTGINTYAQASLKKYMDNQQQKQTAEKFNKYRKAMEDGGYQIDRVETTADGTPKYTFKRKSETPDKSSYLKDPAKAIKLAMAGINPATDLGGLVGIDQPAPAMSLPSGGIGDAAGAPIVDNSEAIRKALISKYAPGYTEDQIKADVFGLPKLDQSKASAPAQSPAMSLSDGSIGDASGTGVSDQYAADIQGLKQRLKTTDQWMVALDQLAMKYVDNAEALKRISALKRLFGAKQSGSSAADEGAMFGPNLDKEFAN